ncbi:hypothetical protein KQX54_007186 [Cotesia glomerata]|uniref:Uncharacterized protein n=1 Tax=Cotesia glomerata TaxID=32391 RepID=A0AAV7IGR8_COTGL|nr:hypothetical protein KQX54_007186 [Cotesia glomerata]
MDQNSMKQSTTIKALNGTSQYVTQNVFRFLKISLVLVLLYLFLVQESSNPFIGSTNVFIRFPGWYLVDLHELQVSESQWHPDVGFPIEKLISSKRDLYISLPAMRNADKNRRSHPGTSKIKGLAFTLFGNDPRVRVGVKETAKVGNDPQEADKRS